MWLRCRCRVPSSGQNCSCLKHTWSWFTQEQHDGKMVDYNIYTHQTQKLLLPYSPYFQDLVEFFFIATVVGPLRRDLCRHGVSGRDRRLPLQVSRCPPLGQWP